MGEGTDIRRFLAVLSGENYSLAKDEILAIAEAEDLKAEIVCIQGKFLIIEAAASLRYAIKRAAMTNYLYEEITILPKPSTFKIESTKRDLIKKYADDLISKGFSVNLTSPIYTFRAERICDYEFFGIKVFERDRRSFEMRKVQYRPFSKPISVHPKLARAMVNLARAKKGKKFLDPFCGTGGILIEACLVGARVYGMDIDMEMVKGSLKNLRYYGLNATVEWGDVSEARKLGKFWSIATDPPYGRSASTKREGIYELYDRAFQVFSDVLEGYLCINLPDDRSVEIGENYLKLEKVYLQRVHKNLTRRICVFSRN